MLLLGGPRIDHKLALELGFDAGFGPGTKPSATSRTSWSATVRRRSFAEATGLTPPSRKSAKNWG